MHVTLLHDNTFFTHAIYYSGHITTNGKQSPVLAASRIHAGYYSHSLPWVSNRDTIRVSV